MAFDPDDIVAWLQEQPQTEVAESDAEADVDDLREYGFSDRTIAETLLLKYRAGNALTLFNVPGLGEKRIATLVSAGLGTPGDLATTSPEELQNLDGISADSARAYIEGVRLFSGDASFVQELAQETDHDPEGIRKAAELLVAIGHPPSDAKEGLRRVFSRSPTLMEICGVDARQAYFLTMEGYESVEDVANAPTNELTDVYYVGSKTATRAQERAVERVEPTDDGQEDESTATEETPDDTKNTDDEPGSASMSNRSESSRETDRSIGEVVRDEDGDETENDENGTDAIRLLVVGSARPNLEYGDNAGIRIRATLESAGYEVTDFDAALYTGFAPRASFHERFDDEGVYNELHEQMGTLASKLPVYYVPGNYGMGDPLENVYEPVYAPTMRSEQFAFAGDDRLTYVPIQGSVSLGGYELTQNPRIGAERDDTILVTPNLYPELWDEHGSVAYIAGGQLTGRWMGDSLVPTFTVENTGPKQEDCPGACHDVTIDDTGIVNHDVVPLDEIETTSCDAHFDRGIQYTIPETGCVFCRNESRYFEELFRAGARQVRRERASGGVEAIVDAVEETAWLSDTQVTAFEEYVRSTLRADQLGQSPDGPTMDATRDPDSELLADPRDVLDRAVITAHSELQISPHDRAAYFDRHDVQDAGTMFQTSDFESARPPLTEEAGEQQVELDREAYERGLLQGEWLIFPRARIVGTVWDFALEEVAAGEFYDAQITTLWHRTARTQRSERHALSIALPNYFELEDAYRVGQRIYDQEWFEIGDDMILFKPLLYSQVGISVWSRREYGLADTVRYRMRDLRKWTSGQ